MVLYFYVKLCKVFRLLPLAEYLIQVIDKLPWKKRIVVIYDQLAPAYVKYYSKKGCIDLMEKTRFSYPIHHRKGYSWVIIAEK